MYTLPRQLILEYISLMKVYDLSNAILRVGPEALKKIEANYRDAFLPEEQYSENPLVELNPYLMLLEGLRKQMEAGISRTEYANHHPVFVGLFPTGKYWAEIRPVEGGFLILVNTGTIEILASSLALLIMNSRVGNEVSVYQAKKVKKVLANILLDHVHHVADARLFAPQFGFISMLSHRMIGQNTLRQDYFYRWFDSCLSLILAHEYSHLLLGHFYSRDSVNKSKTSVQRANIEKEVHADQLAVRLLILSKEPPDEPEAVELWYESFVSSMFIFTLKRAIDDVQRIFVDRANADAIDDSMISERWEKMYLFLSALYNEYRAPPKMLDLPVAFNLWYNDKREDVIQQVKRHTKLPTILRPEDSMSEILKELFSY